MKNIWKIKIFFCLLRAVQVLVCCFWVHPQPLAFCFKRVLIWMTTYGIILGIGNILKYFYISGRCKIIGRIGGCGKFNYVLPTGIHIQREKKNPCGLNWIKAWSCQFHACVGKHRSFLLVGVNTGTAPMESNLLSSIKIYKNVHKLEFSSSTSPSKT